MTIDEKEYKKFIDLLPPIDQKRVLDGNEERLVVIQLLKKAIYWYYNAIHQEYYDKEFAIFRKKVDKKRDEYDVEIKNVYNEINVL
jgi:hypothetical protein